MDTERNYEPADYRRARTAMEVIRRHRDAMSGQEYRTLRGQALAGDIDGAIAGLERIMRRQGGIRMRREGR